MPNDNITTKFRVDISDLKKGITEANRQIKLANAEFKNASAGMDDWKKSTDGLNAKIEQLGSVMKAQEQKVKAYADQLETAKKYQQEASETVQELKTKLEQAKTTYGENSAEVEQYRKELTQAEKSAESMAKEVNNLAVKLNNAEADLKNSKLQTEQYTNALKDLRNESDKTGDELDNLANSSKKVGDSAGTSADGFTTFKGTLADLIASGVEKAIESLGELKEAFLDVADASNVIDTLYSGTDLENWTNAIKGEAQNVYASGYGDSATDVYKLVAQVQRNSKVNIADLEAVAEWLLAMEKYGMDAEETLRGMNALMSQYGLDSDEAMNLMTKGFQNGLNISNEFGDNLAEYTTYFKNAGFSAEEMFTYLESGISAGAYNLDKVNDTFKEFKATSTDIISDTENFEANISSLGETGQEAFRKYANNEITLKELFFAIIEDIKNTQDETEKQAKLMTFLKSQGEDLGIEVVSQLNNVGDAYDKANNSAQEFVDQDMQSLSTQIESFKRELEINVIAPIREDLEPLVKKVIGWVLDHRNEIYLFMKEEVSPELKEWGTRLDKIFGVLEDLLTLYDKLKKAQDKIEEFTGVDMDFMNPIKQGISGLDSFLTLWEGVSGFIKGFENPFKDFEFENPFEDVKIENPFKEIGDYLDEKFGGGKESEVSVNIKESFDGIDIGEKLEEVKEGAVLTFDGIGDDIAEKFNGTKEKITNKFDGVKEGISEKFNGLKESLDEKMQPLKDFHNEYIKPVTDGFGQVASGVGAIFTGIGQHVSYEMGQIKEDVSEKVEETKQSIQEKWSDVKNWFSENVTEPIKEKWSDVKDFAIEKQQEIKDGISEKWSDVKEWVAENITEPIKEKWNDVKDYAVEKQQDIKDGIQEKWSDVKEWCAENITDPIKEKWSDVKDYAIEKQQDIKDGIKEKWSDVKEWWANNITNPIKEKWDALVSGVKGGIEEIKTTIKSVQQTVVNFFVTPIKGAFNTVMSGIETVINGALGAIMDGINYLNGLPGVGINWSYTTVSLPRLEKGGILKKGQIGLLEGNGAEAVIPLDKNKEWVTAIAKEMNNQINILNGMSGGSNTVVNNYNQTINSPKNISRIDIYRQTQNLLNLNKGGYYV